MDEVGVSFGGRISFFKNNWNKITKDPEFLNLIDGVTLEFHQIPKQHLVLPQYKFGPEEFSLISQEIDRFLAAGIVEPSEVNEPGEIISNIFCRRKKSGNIRVIGNFKDLNSEIVYHKFKQSTIQNTLDMIHPGCYMCSIDLTDAYFCVKVRKDYRKFLKFIWNGKHYQFTCLGQGIACAPRLFTKIMKVPLSFLREMGIILIAYLDDILVIADSFEKCLTDTKMTVKLLQELGYVVNFIKSVLTPTQTIEHLGLIINSLDMTAKVTPDKCVHIINICKSLTSNSKPTIREVSRVLGTMISYLPGVEFGFLNYRNLENCKKQALSAQKGNFEAMMALDEGAIEDINWWIENIVEQFTCLLRPKPEYYLSSDSSMLMWGAVLGEAKTGGNWNETEQNQHINVLEMKASLFGLRALCDHLSNTHIRIKTDSKTGACYINAKGGSKSLPCNEVARQIWHWCTDRNIYVSAEHVQGKLNAEADYLSRHQDNSSEWSLLYSVYFDIIDSFKVTPTIDLFANRNNCKVQRFISWQPDPFAIKFDTFLHYFDNEIFWAFPPFNLITKFLRKVQLEKLEGIIVVPCWSTQPFYSPLINLLIDFPIMIRWRKDLLTHPQLETHPLGKKLRLMACHVSGISWKKEAFLKRLSKLSVEAGLQLPKNNISLTLKNGGIFVQNIKLMVMKQM